MWKPADRIKYQAITDEWPTAEQARASQLFSPIQIGPMRLPQRTWVPAMVPWRSNKEGEVTEDVLQWYRRFAEGQPGVIVVEATGIRDIPSGPLLRIGHDRYLDGLKKLVDSVREASQGKTRLLIQIIDFLTIRRRPERDKFLGRFLDITDEHRSQLDMPSAPESEVRQKMLDMDDADLEKILSVKEWEDLNFGYRERVTDTHIEEIANLPKTLPSLFAQAAVRAETAGFDGVELHYAHAYTMSSFLSATNTRTDGYGGDIASRLRLPLEVFHEVRKTVSPDFAVGCRFLSDEIIQGGNRLDDACHIAMAFADAGMDFLSLSRGGKFDDAKQPRVGSAAYPYTGQSGYECMPGYISDPQGPFGRNIEPVHQIRLALRNAGYNTACVVAGGIYDFQQAEAVLQTGKADVIGFARQALADPDWFRKTLSGQGEAVRICRYHNYCEGLDQKHKQVTCELWDREQLDEENIALSNDGRRRLVAPTWRPDEH